MVIRFNQNFVTENDPLRGHSIALFTRIYGDKQTPANAYVIDQPGKPEVRHHYRWRYLMFTNKVLVGTAPPPTSATTTSSPPGPSTTSTPSTTAPHAPPSTVLHP